MYVKFQLQMYIHSMIDRVSPVALRRFVSCVKTPITSHWHHSLPDWELRRAHGMFSFLPDGRNWFNFPCCMQPSYIDCGPQTNGSIKEKSWCWKHQVYLMDEFESDRSTVTNNIIIYVISSHTVTLVGLTVAVLKVCDMANGTTLEYVDC